MNWRINRTINYWLWTKGWAVRKQYPRTRKQNLSIQRFKVPHTKRNYFILGVAFGLVPYITHIQGWLR